MSIYNLTDIFSYNSAIPELDPARYNIPETGATYPLAGILHIGKSTDPSISREKASIERILSHLKSSYTNRIGFEFAHLPVRLRARANNERGEALSSSLTPVPNSNTHTYEKD